jgi:hypothetical protein
MSKWFVWTFSGRICIIDIAYSADFGLDLDIFHLQSKMPMRKAATE